MPAQVVERERLFARLRDGRRLKLTLVACPAGFGKSTLLAAWREREAEERPVAWVTLDDGDNGAVVLWSHVVEALARAGPELPHEELATAAAASPLREVVLPRLVLSTRSDPALPLGALRAHGQLLELRADDLRFSPTEAAEFLNGRLALDLAPGDVALLVARTEGRPAGIYLAALSLAGKPDKSALVHAFDGTSAPRKPASIERSAWALQHAR